MPAWLCATVLDAVFSRSYGGWNCSLNTYGYLVRGSVESGLVTDAIVDDDVDAIYRLFQERRCGPLDLLVGGVPGRESSLLDVSESGPSIVHRATTYDSEVVAAVC